MGIKRSAPCRRPKSTLTNAILGLHVQSGPNGQSTGYECIAAGATTPLPYPCQEGKFNTNVVPEPMTMVLMATGLVGLGAVQIRRRRQQQK
ncbi:MAG: PEP-CTERM sorting domain-containing protein [Gemmatimonadetes bacterium]|nr:PEP-CTERM sorting domain-containing protein [Gemmatimonadota bacterium]